MLYRNGDKYFAPKPVLLEPSRTVNLEHFLEKVTPRFQPFGALRRLYSPNSGRRVTSLEELTDGARFVVGKNEKFKRMSYGGIVNLQARVMKEKRVMRARQIKTMQANAAIFNSSGQFATGSSAPAAATLAGMPGKKKAFASVTGRISEVTQQIGPKLIYVIRNGDLQNVCHPLILTKRNAGTLEQVYQRLTGILGFDTPCRWLYTITGLPIEMLSDFEVGGTYVAVARIQFRQMGYKAATPRPKLLRTKPSTLNEDGEPSKPPPPPPTSMPAADSRELPNAGHEDPAVVFTTKANIKDGKKASGGPRDFSKKEKVVKPPTPVKIPKAKIQPRKITQYQVWVDTGEMEGAGTDAQIWISLRGELGESGRRCITEDESNFQKGSVDQLEFSAPRVGEIYECGSPRILPVVVRVHRTLLRSVWLITLTFFFYL